MKDEYVSTEHIIQAIIESPDTKSKWNIKETQYQKARVFKGYERD